ncbi:hypothetical protein L1887_54386 [Cichorium endivia]|nr:hypothetical protein L1887_54386 [Cichorium endivia]
MFVIGFLNDKVSRLLDAHINSEIFPAIDLFKGALVLDRFPLWCAELYANDAGCEGESLHVIGVAGGGEEVLVLLNPGVDCGALRVELVRDGQRCDLVGEHLELHEQADGHVRHEVAVERPDTRIVGNKAEGDPAEGRHREDVATHRVGLGGGKVGVCFGPGSYPAPDPTRKGVKAVEVEGMFALVEVVDNHIHDDGLRVGDDELVRGRCSRRQHSSWTKRAGWSRRCMPVAVCVEAKVDDELGSHVGSWGIDSGDGHQLRGAERLGHVDERGVGEIAERLCGGGGRLRSA